MSETIVRHPARFSPEIIKAFDVMLGELDARPGPRLHVHDPFAGTGERLGALCDEHGWTFSGTELEPSFIVDPRVVHGDAIDPASYPTGSYVLVTSPPYPNGDADHFTATDSSRRNTYRAHVASNEGRDRELHPNNLGRWGYRGTRRDGPSKRRQTYWALAAVAADYWHGASFVLLNTSDFLADGAREPVTADWVELITRRGWALDWHMTVPTHRQRDGANGDVRVDVEDVVLYRPDGRP